MSSNDKWKKYKLGELIEINAQSITANFPFDEIEYIDTASVTNNKFESVQKIKLSEAPSRAKRIVRDGDVILSTVRPIQRHFGFIRNPKPYTIASTGFAVLTPKKIFPEFLYYYLSQDSITYYLNGIAETTTTTFPAFRPDTLEDLEIEIPDDIETQRRIADILSALDEKIELNRQTNATLESIAQAIFREWFVEFNFPDPDETDPKGLSRDHAPLQAKESGKNGSRQAGQTFRVSGIPQGWRVGKLGDVIEIKGGTTPSTKEEKYWNGEYYWATPKDLSNLSSPILLDTERKITKEGVSQIGSGILPKGTLLLSSRAPIGYLAISNVPISINQGFIAINAKELSNLFMLHWLKENMETIISRANGSTFLEISKTSFKDIELVIPDVQTATRFEEIVSPIFEQINNNEQQSATLAAVRDALLPKLMSGEIEV
ncbi:MAG: restriction endonuclease subunit S [bacterium]|nr:restriction endonuclease subunit S [bacterium]